MSPHAVWYRILSTLAMAGREHAMDKAEIRQPSFHTKSHRSEYSPPLKARTWRSHGGYRR